MPLIRDMETGLRLQALGDQIGYGDEEVMSLLQMPEHQPHTKLRNGHICKLAYVPRTLRDDSWFETFGIPQFWKVQFVVSQFQFEVMEAYNLYGFDCDQLTSFVERVGLHPRDYQDPMVYAHGFPHGAYPNSARYFPERILKRFMFRTEDVDWEPTLDEFRAPFAGYAESVGHGGIILDLAPDLYSSGENLGRPLSIEQGTFHDAALLGMEAQMMSPRVLPGRSKDRGMLDFEFDAEIVEKEVRTDGEIVRHG